MKNKTGTPQTTGYFYYGQMAGVSHLLSLFSRKFLPAVVYLFAKTVFIKKD